MANLMSRMSVDEWNKFVNAEMFMDISAERGAMQEIERAHYQPPLTAVPTKIEYGGYKFDIDYMIVYSPDSDSCITVFATPNLPDEN